MSGKTPDATNSITNPSAVIPVEHKISTAGTSLKQSFAPYSVNVLELNY
jgi:alpha-L-arabinofuranosidase